jgi:nitronate monooxygenase
MELLGLTVRWPVIGAPMAGGPSTPALAAAVSGAGGLGFLAAGYRTPQALSREIAELRELTAAPFGVNVFVPQDPAVDDRALSAYLTSLRTDAEAFDVDLVPSWNDDDWADKVALLESEGVPLVSFTFGCPPAPVVARLHDAGSRVVVTVTTPAEALLASAAGVDALCAQGIEAGGHQSTFSDDVAPDTGWGLLALLTAIRHEVGLPVIASGGLMTGSDVAAVVRAGAVAGQLGTALVRSTESGAHGIHKAALADPAFEGTAITRAFSGRRARGLVNRFMRAHPDAPSAYPQINSATAALRRAAVIRGDPHALNLWAGQGYRLAEARPAGEIVTRIGTEFDDLMEGR